MTPGGPVPPESPRRFIAQLEQNSALAAAAAGGWRDVNLTLAGAPVRLRFAGSALESIVAPAFAHLTTANGNEPALTVHLWDSESTGTPIFRAPWNREASMTYGKIEMLSDERVFTDLQHGSRALSSIDTDRGRAFFWVPSAASRRGEGGTTPLLAILDVWLRDRGIVVTHAAAVGSSAGCVAVVGKKGSGKSSSALACLSSGMGILADDYCAIAPAATPIVFSLFSTAKAHEDALARMPSLAPLAGDRRRPSDGKALLFMHQHHPEQLVASAPLRAVLIPHITSHQDTTIRPASASQALAALAPSTIMQLHGRTQATLSRLAAIATTVNCYHLYAGSDPVGLAAKIASLLS